MSHRQTEPRPGHGTNARQCVLPKSIPTQHSLAAGWLPAVALAAALVGGVRGAQAATVVLGEGAGVPGQSGIALPLSLTIAAGEQISALAVDVYFDPLLTQWQSVALEPTVSALGKQVQTNLVAPGHARVVIYGLDRQVLSSGTLGQCLVQVPATTGTGSAILSLRDGSGADANGGEISLGLSDGRIWINAPTDATAPTLTVSGPADGAVFPQGSDVVVSGTALDELSGSVAVTVNGISTAVGSGGAFTQTLSGLAAGTQQVLIQAVDGSGNVAQAQRTITVQAAIAGPVVTILNPAPDSTVQGPSVTILFSVSGASVRTGTGYTHLHIRLDSGSVWHVYNTKPFPLTLKPGQHTVAVMLADNATHKRVPGDETYQRVTFTVAPCLTGAC